MHTSLVLAVIGCLFVKVLSQNQLLCESKIYCQGELLDKVQMAQIFKDSKIFVDMKMTKSEDIILEDFNELLQKCDQNPSKTEIKKFVEEHFEQFDEFDNWTPSDYSDNQAFISKIKDKEIKKFAEDIVKIWPTLTKKIKKEVLDSPESYSLIPVKNGFVLPGEQSKEFGYWGTYFTVRGLLLSEMSTTVKGMLENFFSLIEQYGFVPRGNRVYYLDTSEPPMLTRMVYYYIEATKDMSWLGKNIATIDKELTFWLNERSIEVEKDGTKYTLAHYASKRGTPRPEMYYKDVEIANTLTNDSQKIQLHLELNSGAESGWDFSSRWLVDSTGGNTGDLKDAQTRRIIPADLNALLYQSYVTISSLYTKLNNKEKTQFWSDKAKELLEAIDKVLFNEEEGVWFDYDTELSQQRNVFYASNLVPLLCQAFNPDDAKKFGKKALEYLKKQEVLNYEGGIPPSLKDTGLKWDMPSALPPLQYIVMAALYRSGDEDAGNVTRELAKNWLKSNLAAYKNNGVLYEKYDATKFGEAGKAGKFDVKTGFGWTIGVDLMMITTYYIEKDR